MFTAAPVLQDDLGKSGVAAFLAQYGYQSIDIDYALNRLRERFNAGEDFPHEIGLFLDYPLGDVIGFIENEGLQLQTGWLLESL